MPVRSGLEISDTSTAESASLSVVIPAYNEEGIIGPLLDQLRRTLEATGGVHEIIVVDDGSTDGTAAEAEAGGARVLYHGRNRGYGAALKTGIRKGRYGLICIADADGTYPVEEIPRLVERLKSNGCDMVVGARAANDAAIPRVRRPAKWFIGRLAEMVAGRPIPDLNSGLRVFRRETALRFSSLLPDGFSFTTTITLAMLSNAYEIDYTPIRYHRRAGRSKIRPVQDTLNFIGLILRIALYFAPLKIFLPVSAFLLLMAAVWGIASKLVLGQLADVSTVVIVVAAIQVAVVGLLAEMINLRVSNSYRPRD